MRKKLIKLLKILLLSILTLLIITIATLYFSLHEKLPEGKPGQEADEFALKILDAVKHDNYLNTDYLKWTFRNKNHYLWNKKLNIVTVKIDDHSVLLHLDSPEKNEILSTLYFNDQEKKKMIEKALVNFNNDSFWLVAPHKLFDKGVIRKVVTIKDNTKGLLVTYQSGGTTPGDSYLWKVDTNYRPISYKMWVSIIPIGGLEATWENWTITKTGAHFSQHHKLLGFGIPISDLKTWND
ncbi:hypothetical protein ATE84_3180 [Aquimarina sp. MAR_2010_214]|uniref:hypothetical protein n=1 Tax=Aquimarina sp. MAR_2010_214 TaxID=1250026 RepID=UPI000CBEABC5|nr:hypothetical protein [Aquimarina sp. MAR_2010_214]PKV51111.1 hypothetical protein ATE84_3180 [Aquimarina sp. MAR_2010_214]